REGDAVVDLAELGDLRRGAGLLVHELVAGEAEHPQPPVAVALVQRLQPGVLRREPAPAGRVDHQDHGAEVLRERLGAARDGGGGEVGESRHVPIVARAGETSGGARGRALDRPWAGPPAGAGPVPPAPRTTTAPPHRGLVHILATSLLFAPTCENDGCMTISPHVLGPEGESSAQALLDGLREQGPEALAAALGDLAHLLQEIARDPGRGFALEGRARRDITDLLGNLQDCASAMDALEA